MGRIQSLLALRPDVEDVGLKPIESDGTAGGGVQRWRANASAALLLADPLSVAFEAVSFHYEDNENMLEDVTFTLQSGQTLCILGRTGSGKSTLTRLLFHLYDPTCGRIRLGGFSNDPRVDLRDIPLGELRGRIGLVTQEVQLFQATVRDNLTLFDPSIPDERLETILRAPPAMSSLHST